MDEVLGAVGLSDRAGQPVGEFSRGMVQRLHLARALLTRPGLLILDEPSNGLDVQAARDLRDLVRASAHAGTGVLLTTHSMPEAELLGDRIDVVRRGELIVSGGVAAVAAAAGIRAVTTVLTRERGDLVATFEGLPGVARVDRLPMHGQTVYNLLWRSSPGPSVRALAGPDTHVLTREPTLEESYLALE